MAGSPAVTPERALALQQETGRVLVAAVDANLIRAAEVRPAAGMAAVVRGGGTLTAEQYRQAWRMLVRHEQALLAAGLAVPGRERPAQQARPARQEPVARPPAARGSGSPTLALNREGRIVCKGSPYALKDAIKAEAFAAWDKRNKVWHTAATPAHAAALVGLLEPYRPQLSQGVADLVEEFTRRAAQRAVLDPDTPLPQVDMAPLMSGAHLAWGHQVRAVEFASVASPSAALFAIPMGGGKTAAAIATTNRVRAQRVIIVCPNKVRGVWPREVRRWSPDSARWHIVDGKRPARKRGAPDQDMSVAARLEQAEHCLFDCACGAAVHAAVFNYEMLIHEPVKSWVPPVQLDLVIYDEAHKLKSYKRTGMSGRAYEWVDFFKRRLGLTGTPMPQNPWDIFGTFRALDPGIFGPLWTPFKAKYVVEKERKDDGKMFPVGIKKEERAGFAAKVHSIMYRPQIDLQLPPVTHQIRAVTLEPAARRAYDELLREQMTELSPFVGLSATELDARGDDAPILSPSNVLARTTRLRQLTGGTLPDDGEVIEGPTGKAQTVRTKYRVSTAKADLLAELLDEIGCVAPDRLNAEQREPEPVAVYCKYVDDLNAVREVAASAGLRYGEISGRRSDGLTGEALMNPNVDVVGVQIASGGTGVDLTRACYGIWYSCDYSLGDYDQALKRQDRPGQKRPVRFIHLVAEDTIDEELYRSLAAKRSLVAVFLAARGVSPRAAGLDDADGDAIDLTMDDVAEEFNRRAREEGTSGRTGGGVVLPIDEYAADPFPLPRGRTAHRREPDAVDLDAIDADQLAEYGLEGFV